MLQRLADAVLDDAEGQAPRMYRDPSQPALDRPAQVPAALQDFARQSLSRALDDPRLLACMLGEYLSEPKPSVWFEPDESAAGLPLGHALELHARTRMLYDADHVFINGESYLARGADARLMRELADARRLSARQWQRASEGARDLLEQWLADGWLVVASE